MTSQPSGVVLHRGLEAGREGEAAGLRAVLPCSWQTRLPLRRELTSNQVPEVAEQTFFHCPQQPRDTEMDPASRHWVCCASEVEGYRGKKNEVKGIRKSPGLLPIQMPQMRQTLEPAARGVPTPAAPANPKSGILTVTRQMEFSYSHVGLFPWI